MAAVWQDVLGADLGSRSTRLTHAEAMRRFGTDKPDLRYGMELADLGRCSPAPGSASSPARWRPGRCSACGSKARRPDPQAARRPHRPGQGPRGRGPGLGRGRGRGPALAARQVLPDAERDGLRKATGASRVTCCCWPPTAPVAQTSSATCASAWPPSAAWSPRAGWAFVGHRVPHVEWTARPAAGTGPPPLPAPAPKWATPHGGREGPPPRLRPGPQRLRARVGQHPYRPGRHPRRVFDALGIGSQEAEDRFGFFLRGLAYAPPRGGFAFGSTPCTCSWPAPPPSATSSPSPRPVRADPLTGAPTPTPTSSPRSASAPWTPRPSREIEADDRVVGSGCRCGMAVVQCGSRQRPTLLVAGFRLRQHFDVGDRSFGRGRHPASAAGTETAGADPTCSLESRCKRRPVTALVERCRNGPAGAQPPGGPLRTRAVKVARSVWRGSTDSCHQVMPASARGSSIARAAPGSSGVIPPTSTSKGAPGSRWPRTASSSPRTSPGSRGTSSPRRVDLERGAPVEAGSPAQGPGPWPVAGRPRSAGAAAVPGWAGTRPGRPARPGRHRLARPQPGEHREALVEPAARTAGSIGSPQLPNSSSGGVAQPAPSTSRPPDSRSSVTVSRASLPGPPPRQRGHHRPQPDPFGRQRHPVSSTHGSAIPPATPDECEGGPRRRSRPSRRPRRRRPAQATVRTSL